MPRSKTPSLDTIIKYPIPRKIVGEAFELAHTQRDDCERLLEDFGYSPKIYRIMALFLNAGVSDFSKRYQRMIQIEGKTTLEYYQAQYGDEKGRIVYDNYLKKLRISSSNVSPETRKASREKSRLTCIARYGVDNPAKSSIVKKRTSETCINRYGVEHFLAHPDTKQKIAQTNLKKYGHENFLASDQGKKTSEDRMLERYGVKNCMQVPEFKARVIETHTHRYGDIYASARKGFIEKYGVSNPFQLDFVKDKIAQTNLQKYGVSNPNQSSRIKEKTKVSIRARYGVDNVMHRHYTEEAKDILFDEDKFKQYITKSGAIALSDQLGIEPSTVYDYCARYGLVFEGNSSSGERALATSIEAFGIEVVRNSRSLIAPMELDIYIPSHNLAIEFNGLYWHSSLHLDKSYHRRKYEACRDAGIRLLMVSEDEWIERSDIVISKIRNILGKSERGVGARKLKMLHINTVTANDFFERHHLQGATGSLIAAYGAFNGDDLVAVMGYNRQRGTQAVELIRYATDGKTYPGIFSRLFRFSREAEGYTDILSFADLRYSEGDVYEKNGFDLVAEIGPDYKYVLGNSTMHKSSFTKAKIAKRFAIDVEGKTERELMESLGIPRIYDCGKLRYRWRL